MDIKAKIGVINERGTIDSVYCSLDGDIENVGRLLLENYNDYALASKLVSYGDIYRLKKYLDKGIFTDESKEETTIFDIRDQKLSWSLYKTSHNRTLNSYLNSSRERGATYAYLFDKERNEWLCYDLVLNKVDSLSNLLNEDEIKRGSR